MIGISFYHETIRTAVAVFGSLFNNIVISRRDGKVVPVPIAYGPRVKWLDAQGQLTQTVESFENLLPRMSYELSGMNYDTNRKINNKQMVSGISPLIGGKSPRVNAPVPYNLDFKLNLQTKNLNDGWQIVEQILPFFQPSYTVRVRNFPDTPQFGGNQSDSDQYLQPLNEFDMPITFEAITWDDGYQGEIGERREVNWELTFNTKVNLWGPVSPITIIYNSSIALGIDNSTDFGTTPISDLSSISTVGYYNQSAKFTKTGVNFISRGANVYTILNGVYSGLPDPYHLSYAGTGSYILPEQDFTVNNPNIDIPIYMFVYPQFTASGDPTINATPVIDRNYYLVIDLPVDSDGVVVTNANGVGSCEVRYFKFDPTTPDSESIHPIITDISDSDGHVTRVVHPIIV